MQVRSPCSERLQEVLPLLLVGLQALMLGKLSCDIGTV